MERDKDAYDTHLYADRQPKNTTVKYTGTLGNARGYHTVWYHWNGAVWEEAASFDGPGASQRVLYEKLQATYASDTVRFDLTSTPPQEKTERFQLVATNETTGEVVAAEVITITVSAD